MPSAEFLRRLYHYDPLTGILSRKSRRDPLVLYPIGKRDRSGHLRVQFPKGVPTDRKTSSCHRIGWIIVHGDIPDHLEIDHINRVPNDNRIENLRLVSHQENMRNQSIRFNNRTGVTGIVWNDEISKWCARIRSSDGTRLLYLGAYDSPEEATAARRAAQVVLEYSPGHGKKKPPLLRAA